MSTMPLWVVESSSLRTKADFDIELKGVLADYVHIYGRLYVDGNFELDEIQLVFDEMSFTDFLQALAKLGAKITIRPYYQCGD